MRRRPLRRTKLKVDEVTSASGRAARMVLAWAALIALSLFGCLTPLSLHWTARYACGRLRRLRTWSRWRISRSRPGQIGRSWLIARKLHLWYDEDDTFHTLLQKLDCARDCAF